MILPLSGQRTLKLIGDPHLGKDFDNGTPEHRKGERATRQMAQFIEELSVEADYVVQVGDLFDNPYVSRSVVVSAAQAALGAAERSPETTFIHMAGNHDKPRNLNAVGAWTLFARMVQYRLPNLYVATYPMQLGCVAVFPWEWDKTAKQQVQDFEPMYDDNPRHVEVVVGHWDLELFGDDDSHLAPTQEMQQVFGKNTRFASGHFHVPGTYKVHGIPVQCTGSMQPYSHGEDPEGKLYLTLTLQEFESMKPEALRDKCVRVMLPQGEVLPDVDCLALTHKRIAAEGSEVVLETGSDLAQVVHEEVETLDQEVRDFIYDRLPEFERPSE